MLRTFAVSRLLLDNVPHVKVLWVMHGLDTARSALRYGADDLDGSVVEYKITHDVDGFGTPAELSREQLLDLIRGEGFRPVEAQHPLRDHPRVPVNDPEVWIDEQLCAGDGICVEYARMSSSSTSTAWPT